MIIIKYALLLLLSINVLHGANAGICADEDIVSQNKELQKKCHDFGFFHTFTQRKIAGKRSATLSFDLFTNNGSNDFLAQLDRKIDSWIKGNIDPKIANLEEIKKRNMKKFNLKNYLQDTYGTTNVAGYEEDDITKKMDSIFQHKKLLRKWEEKKAQKKQECQDDAKRELEDIKFLYYKSPDAQTSIYRLIKRIDSIRSNESEEISVSCKKYITEDDVVGYGRCIDSIRINSAPELVEIRARIAALTEEYSTKVYQIKHKQKNCLGFTTVGFFDEKLPELVELRRLINTIRNGVLGVLDRYIDLKNYESYRSLKAKLLEEARQVDNDIYEAQDFQGKFDTWVYGKIEEQSNKEKAKCDIDFANKPDEITKCKEKVQKKKELYGSIYAGMSNNDIGSVYIKAIQAEIERKGRNSGYDNGDYDLEVLKNSVGELTEKGQNATFSTKGLFERPKVNDMCTLLKCTNLSATEKYSLSYRKYKLGLGSMPAGGWTSITKYSDFFKNNCPFSAEFSEADYNKRLKKFSQQMMLVAIQKVLQELIINVYIKEGVNWLKNAAVCTGIATYQSLTNDVKDATSVGTALVAAKGDAKIHAAASRRYVRCLMDKTEFLKDVKMEVVSKGGVSTARLALSAAVIGVPYSQLTGVPFGKITYDLSAKMQMLSPVHKDLVVDQCKKEFLSQNFADLWDDCMALGDKISWNPEFDLSYLTDAMEKAKEEKCFSFKKGSKVKLSDREMLKAVEKFRRSIYDPSEAELQGIKESLKTIHQIIYPIEKYFQDELDVIGIDAHNSPTIACMEAERRYLFTKGIDQIQSGTCTMKFPRYDENGDLIEPTEEDFITLDFKEMLAPTARTIDAYLNKLIYYSLKIARPVKDLKIFEPSLRDFKTKNPLEFKETMRIVWYLRKAISSTLGGIKSEEQKRYHTKSNLNKDILNKNGFSSMIKSVTPMERFKAYEEEAIQERVHVVSDNIEELKETYKKEMRELRKILIEKGINISN
jgi:hypothetical protein